MTANIQRLTMALAIAFVVTALMVSFWGVVRSAALLAREDNPRLVDTELSIQRGQILDRNGVPLAISLPDNGFLTRSYPNLEAAGVVGYYSLRFGVGGIEAAYDDVLRGEAFIDSEGQRIANRLLHRPQIGGDVRLTIDLAIQQVAEEALTEQRGALVVVDVESGDILAMTSSPTFDPNRVDDSWESLLDDPDAPLVNRVTQGLYNPGTALQSVLLAAALNAGEVDLQAPIVPDQLKATVGTGQFTLNCALTPDAPLETLLDAYQWGCPAPFIEIGNALGRQRFDGALQDFGLTTAVLLGLSPDLVADVQAPQSSDLNELVLGHADLQVTPLQMALVAAAIANHGEAPALRLVDAIRPPDVVIGNPCLAKATRAPPSLVKQPICWPVPCSRRPFLVVTVLLLVGIWDWRWPVTKANSMPGLLALQPVMTASCWQLLCC